MYGDRVPASLNVYAVCEPKSRFSDVVMVESIHSRNIYLNQRWVEAGNFKFAIQDTVCIAGDQKGKKYVVVDRSDTLYYGVNSYRLDGYKWGWVVETMLAPA